MRMWMIEPKILCRKHLLGEHVELHMLVGSIKRKKRLDGFVRNGLLELGSLAERHNDLVAEMTKRGYNHASPLDVPDISYLSNNVVDAKVDREAALKDLLERCDECKQNELEVNKR